MDALNKLNSNRRGYLKGDFEFFHLKDKRSVEFELHYHDFEKIIIFISGKVTYLIEGKAYALKPWDILFISNNDIHKPIIDHSEVYERIVIWVNPSFLDKHGNKECNLLACFIQASLSKFNLLRLNSELLKNIKNTLFQLEETHKSKDMGSRILSETFILQLFVYLNRLWLTSRDLQENIEISYDENISTILDYINKNPSEDLSINKLSSMFYTSEYYLMHKFKLQTGYTIHNYILQKRLLKANTLIKKGRLITEVCLECGFCDYSNFMRAYKKMFGISPKKYYKNTLEFSE